MAQRTIITLHRQLSRLKYRPHCYTGRFNHELFLDFEELPLEDQPKDYKQPRRYTEFLSQLRKTVQENPDIDVITMEPVNNGPDDRIWKALEGLQPKHLEVRTGYAESCDLFPLDSLSPPWSLSSLCLESCIDMGTMYEPDETNDPFDINGTISNNNNDKSNLIVIDELAPQWPASLSSLESLYLSYCCGLTFHPKGGAGRLKSLTILKNDAMNMFMSTIDSCPEVAPSLLSLTISSTNGCDLNRRYEAWEFRKRLKRCIALQSLEIVVVDDPSSSIRFGRVSEDEDEDSDDEGDDDPNSSTPSSSPSVKITKKNRKAYSDLPTHLPPSLTHFTFLGPNSEGMLFEMDKWVEHATDPTWLPNLKTISFNTDLKTKYGLDYTDELAVLREEFLGILCARTPRVTVVPCRDVLK